MNKLAILPKGHISPQWVFENNPPMGGAAGEAYTNTLASSGMPPAAVLAREAIQNSVDARVPGQQKAVIDFVAKAVTGSLKAEIAQAADLFSVRDRSDQLKFAEPNCLSSLSDPSAALRMLYINDYNTTGLQGDPSDPSSKFYRFLLSLGDGGKEHEEHSTGGSYGFGKSVYSSNSGVLTIFAYSRTVDQDGNPITLFFGCGYYRKHKFNEGQFTGRAWFGEDISGDSPFGQQVVKPLINGAADDMAARLGFEPRDPGQLGTSVLILDALVEPSDILKGVEDWWWPRLVSHQLDVRVIDDTGTVHFPRPRKREDLKPFVEAFDLALGTSPANTKTDFKRPLNKIDGKSVGVVGFKVLERGDEEQYLLDEARVDAVALIRGPLMVVSYYREWGIGSPAMAGAFIADEDIDDILRSSEPPAHDRWDVGARRLLDQSGFKRSVVDRVLKNIRRNLKTCQGTASPPPPPRPKRLTILERALANFLAPAKRGSGKDIEAAAAPIHLSYLQEPRAYAEGAKLRLRAIFSVKLKAGEEIEGFIARVKITCPIVEDGQTGDLIGLSVSASATLHDDPDKQNWSRFELGTTMVKFDCISEPYDPLYTVKFVPEVEPVETL